MASFSSHFVTLTTIIHPLTSNNLFCFVILNTHQSHRNHFFPKAALFCSFWIWCSLRGFQKRHSNIKCRSWLSWEWWQCCHQFLQCCHQFLLLPHASLSLPLPPDSFNVWMCGGSCPVPWISHYHRIHYWSIFRFLQVVAFLYVQYSSHNDAALPWQVPSSFARNYTTCRNRLVAWQNNGDETLPWQPYPSSSTTPVSFTNQSKDWSRILPKMAEDTVPEDTVPREQTGSRQGL